MVVVKRSLAREAFPYLIFGGLLVALFGNHWATHVPLTPEEAEQERAVEMMKEFVPQIAEQVGGATGRYIEDQFDRASPRARREPPYRQAGDAVIVGGGLLVLLGLFAWCRTSDAAR